MDDEKFGFQVFDGLKGFFDALILRGGLDEMDLVALVEEDLCGDEKVFRVTLDAASGFCRPTGDPDKIIPVGRVEDDDTS